MMIIQRTYFKRTLDNSRMIFFGTLEYFSKYFEFHDDNTIYQRRSEIYMKRIYESLIFQIINLNSIDRRPNFLF